jgi:hypothetical protein
MPERNTPLVGMALKLSWGKLRKPAPSGVSSLFYPAHIWIPDNDIKFLLFVPKMAQTGRSTLSCCERRPILPAK